MADDTVSVKITADASGVAPGVDEAKVGIEGLGATTETVAATMKSAFAGVQAQIKEIAISTKETAEVMIEFREMVAGIGEVMLAAFAVEKVVDWAKEMGEAAEKTSHLSEIFGMSVPQVEGLGAAAKLSGMGMDELTRAMGILDKNLATAGDGTGPAAQAFKALGISAKDGKDQMTLLMDVAGKFAGMADGPEKVALAMAIFGRAGRDMIPMLNKGKEGIEELDRTMQAYSAGTLKKTGEATQELRDWLAEANEKGLALAESTNVTGVAMQGVSNVMTDAFAPMLKDATDCMNELIKAFIDSYREGGFVAVAFEVISGACETVGAVIGALGEIISEFWGLAVDLFKDIASAAGITFGKDTPTAINTTRGVFNDLIDLIVIAKDIIVGAFAVLRGAVNDLAINFDTACKVIWDALHFNWGAIQADWAAGMKAIADNAVAEAHRVTAAVNEAKAAISAFSKDENVHGGAEGGGKGDDSKKPKAPGIGHGKKPKKEKAASGDKDNSAETDLEELKDAAKAKEAIAADSAKTTLELAKLSAQEQFAAVDEAEKKGLISKKQAAAQKAAILATEVQAEIAAADAIYQAKVAEIKAEDAAESASLAAKQAALDKSDKDYKTKFDNLQNEIQAKTLAYNNQLLVLSTQHENQLTVIKAKGVADRIKLDDQATATAKNNLQKTVDSFSQGLAKMATGQRSFMQELNAGWTGMLNIVDKVISQMISQWIMGLAVKEGVTKAADQKDTMRDAMAAARKAYNSQAAIPVVGPMLGAAAAAVAFTTVEAFSAAGGWDNVPYDGAQTTLHKNEMVLPANLATPLRSMLTSGNGQIANDHGSNDNSGGDTHVHIHATDADSVKKLLSSEAGIAGIRSAMHKASAGLKS